jgi:hypothetical protein
VLANRFCLLAGVTRPTTAFARPIFARRCRPQVAALLEGVTTYICHLRGLLLAAMVVLRLAATPPSRSATSDVGIG